jgi:hypothetical protein
MEFEVIYGVRFDAETASQFDRFYTTKVQSEILQEIGRLRAGRRRNQPLDLYITATEDLSFLEEHGLQISGYEIHPDLDNDRDRIIRSFISGEIDLDYSKMSVRKLSAKTGISKSSIGRYLSQEGFFDGVPLENLPKTIGERVAALVENVKADPEYLAYYLGTVLKNTKDPAARELVKSTTLKILAMNKQQIKKFKRLDSINQAAIAARALAMGIELTSYNVASIEKTLI